MNAKTQTSASTSGKANSGGSRTTSKATDTPTTVQVAAKAHEVIDSAADKGQDLERKLRDQASSAQQKLGEKKEVASNQVDETLAQVEGFIKDRPLAAAGIAFAAGMIATRLFRS